MGTNFNHDTGFIRDDEEQKRVLKLDGVPFARFMRKDNNLGMYVIGNKLYDCGSMVAVSAEQNPALVLDGVDTNFGGVKLVTEGKVINITLADYNKLYKRTEEAGFKYFDPLDVYRVFADAIPNPAPVVTYTRENGILTFTEGTKVTPWPERPYLLYNNVVGEDVSPYTENNVNTVTELNSPQLTVRYFNPRILLGDKIKIPIAVDDYEISYIYDRTVTGPYTIELRIEDKDGEGFAVTKTIFAGESIIETPAFNTAGETWFTLRCIDANGVGSAVHYLDVYVEDPAYRDNFKEADDDDLAANGIIPDNDDLIIAYKNKAGLTALFAQAVAEGKNGIVMPKGHTYYICDYANKSSDPDKIDLGADGIRYWLVELEEVVENGEVVGNTFISKEELTLEDVKADSENIYRYGSYSDEWDSEHINDIIFANRWSFSYFYSLPKAVRKAIRYQCRNFHVYTLDNIETLTAGTRVDKKASVYDEDQQNNVSVMMPSGKYYVRSKNDVTFGDHIIFPSNFTIDLNGTTIEVVNRYDDPTTGYSIVLERLVNTHIKNGTLHGGLDKCDWLRAVCQTSQENPFEFAYLFAVNGCRWCSMTNVKICEYKGYGSNHSYATDEGYKNWGADTSGRYKKRLDLESGYVEDCYTGVDTLVASNTSGSESDVGYLSLLRTETYKYIYVGYGGIQPFDKAKRKEIFILFYNDSNELVKAVKSRLTWLVRIPDTATKYRVMAYWMDYNQSGTVSCWRNIYAYQVIGTVGMVYKDMEVYNTRSCIFNGDQREVLHENITFKNIALPSMVNRHGQGCWAPITALVFDIENSGPLCKYFTINNCRVVEDNNEASVVRGCVIQHGEHIQISNNNGFTLSDKRGMQSALIEGNTFVGSRCIDIMRGTAINFHPFIQYQDNVCDAADGGMTVYYSKYNPSGYDEEAESEKFDDQREWKVPMRMMTMNKAVDSTFANYKDFQNSKIGDEYID